MDPKSCAAARCGLSFGSRSVTQTMNVVLAYLICAPLCVDDAAARHAPQRMRAHAVYICMCAVICFSSMRSIKISSCMHACMHAHLLILMRAHARMHTNKHERGAR